MFWVILTGELVISVLMYGPDESISEDVAVRYGPHQVTAMTAAERASPSPSASASHS